MLSTSPPTDADRIALTRMFKAIAEYGRKMRLRNLTNRERPGQEIHLEPEPDGKGHPQFHKRKHARKNGKGKLKIK